MFWIFLRSFSYYCHQDILNLFFLLMSMFSYTRCCGGRYISSGLRKNQIHWQQVLKQLLKGITAVGTGGKPLNGLWDVVFKQPLLLPLSGTERWAGCCVGVTCCVCSPCSCCSWLLSGSGCRCKRGLFHTSQAVIVRASQCHWRTFAVAWPQSTSVSGRKRKK